MNPTGNEKSETLRGGTRRIRTAIQIAEFGCGFSIFTLLIPLMLANQSHLCYN